MLGTNTTYSIDPDVGEDSTGTDLGGNTVYKGGIGAEGGAPGSGDGGNGGKGGTSGSEGIYKSPLLEKSQNFNYEQYYSPGRKADQVRFFP